MLHVCLYVTNQARRDEAAGAEEVAEGVEERRREGLEVEVDR